MSSVQGHQGKRRSHRRTGFLERKSWCSRSGNLPKVGAPTSANPNDLPCGFHHFYIYRAVDGFGTTDRIGTTIETRVARPESSKGVPPNKGTQVFEGRATQTMGATLAIWLEILDFPTSSPKAATIWA